MSREEQNKLNKELRFIEDEENRIKTLVTTLPDLAKRKHEVIIQLYPHHNRRNKM